MRGRTAFTRRRGLITYAYVPLLHLQPDCFMFIGVASLISVAALLDGLFLIFILLLAVCRR